MVSLDHHGGGFPLRRLSATIDPIEPLRRSGHAESHFLEVRTRRDPDIRPPDRSARLQREFPRRLGVIPLVSSALVAPELRREVNNVTKLMTLFKREEGQTMAEYGVVLAVITLGVILALTALSGGISGAINNVVGNL